MANVMRRGKKRIMSNNGHVQLSMNDNRVLTYDGEEYRFISGDKPDGQVRTEISNNGSNVLDLP